jgi:hypothetical protein
VQRTAWTIMAFAAIAALLGLLGHGPLGSAESSDREKTLTLEFYRFERYQAPTKLLLTVSSTSIESETVRLWVSKEYVDRFEFQEITPKPVEIGIGKDVVLYSFRVLSGSKAVKIVFPLKAERCGLARGRLGLVNGGELAFRQFVYP